VRRCGVILAALLSVGAQEAPRRPPVVLGYYPSWVAHPSPKEIRYERFTHLAHAFLKSDAEGNLREDRAIPSRELTQRAHQQGVKVLLSLGGAHSARTFREIVRTKDALARYAAAVAKAAADFGYDGVDVDWEPTEGEDDRRDLAVLVRTLRSAFPGGILSMAAPASDWYGRACDADELRKHVDFLNVMTYDFHGPWSAHAGHNAPLRAAPDDEDGAVASVESGIAYWRDQRNWPLDRMNVGIPCYGRGFAVTEWHRTPAGKAPHETIAQRDVAELLRDGARRVWDPKVGVPTLMKAGELVSYEDAQSAALKGAWAREKGLRGVFFWQIEQDWADGDHDVVRAAAKAFLGH